MQKTVLKFGLISGAIISILMSATVPFADKLGHSLLLGYTTMVLSFMMVFFGIRSYRDNVGNGQISFGRAFAVGISITLISCICYVFTWEIIYFNFMPDFMDKYAAHMIDQMKNSGASAAVIQAKAQEFEKLKVMYKNPIINSLMTFIEPFPVGLIITLISAATLKKKQQLEPGNQPLPA